LQAPNLIVFQGNDFNTRVAQADENFIIPDSVFFAGSADVLFAKNTGLPLASSTIVIQSGSDSATITINEKGKVEKL